MRWNGVRSRGIEFQLAFCLASLSASSLLRTLLCAQTCWITIFSFIFWIRNIIMAIRSFLGSCVGRGCYHVSSEK